MSKPLKETKVGQWLREKAPSVLDVVGDVLPDRGVLGVVKNLVDKDPTLDSAEFQALLEAEMRAQENVTERWKADAASDVKLAKMIQRFSPSSKIPNPWSDRQTKWTAASGKSSTMVELRWNHSLSIMLPLGSGCEGKSVGKADAPVARVSAR